MSEAGQMGTPVTIRRSEVALPEPSFPEEVAVVTAAHAEAAEWTGSDAVIWGIGSGMLKKGEVVVAEVSPTLRCTEDCFGCPDRISLLKPGDKEVRATPEEMIGRAKQLRDLGVRHVMNIGGTIDKIRYLSELIHAELDSGLTVSWFTDCIVQIEENGDPSQLLLDNLEDGWIKDVATHVSTDYVYGHSEIDRPSLFADEIVLPTKRGRQGEFREDPEYSKEFKSQYSIVGARRLVEAGVRRVVLNMTIAHANADQITALYEQAVSLQNYGESLGSPTEVLFTFSPWVWRPHQARGGDPGQNPADSGLHYEDMPGVNAAMQAMLADTYDRIMHGRPRILANSSGYTNLHAERAFNTEAVEQDVAYPGGRSLMLNVNPRADIMLDPMFVGPELEHVRGTFGYMDRTFDPANNPFVDFHHNNHLYLPNLIGLPSRSAPEAQPLRIMDHRLASMIVRRHALLFGENIRNKHDSPHLLGNPRVLGSNPFDIQYIAERILDVAQNDCEGDVLMGLASFGHGLATAASVLSANTDRPMRNGYVKLAAEEHKGKQKIEGHIDLNERPILIDDLLFHGETKRDAIRILEESGFSKTVLDMICIIDRQLERVDKGPSLRQDGYRVHALITMTEIIQYMVDRGAITPEQLQHAIEDYNLFDRHILPDFAAVGKD